MWHLFFCTCMILLSWYLRLFSDISDFFNIKVSYFLSLTLLLIPCCTGIGSNLETITWHWKYVVCIYLVPFLIYYSFLSSQTTKCLSSNPDLIWGYRGKSGSTNSDYLMWNWTVLWQQIRCLRNWEAYRFVLLKATWLRDCLFMAK